mmetsp:Transcript_3798/g.23984  ORF Transcript_3798/g.23984 Transcript_3798/m.23984 type:complete len:284 (+) Transcript_3798:1497-2348(+)
MVNFPPDPGFVKTSLNLMMFGWCESLLRMHTSRSTRFALSMLENMLGMRFTATSASSRPSLARHTCPYDPDPTSRISLYPDPTLHTLSPTQYAPSSSPKRRTPPSPAARAAMPVPTKEHVPRFPSPRLARPRSPCRSPPACTEAQPRGKHRPHPVCSGVETEASFQSKGKEEAVRTRGTNPDQSRIPKGMVERTCRKLKQEAAQPRRCWTMRARDVCAGARTDRPAKTGDGRTRCVDPAARGGLDDGPDERSKVQSPSTPNSPGTPGPNVDVDPARVAPSRNV